jgi:AhpD family alkylhydroperoxidase
VAAASGPLDARTRERVKLGMAAASRSESAVHSHVHRAIEAGASRAEVEHALLLGVTTIGFPRAMAALTWADAALEARGRIAEEAVLRPRRGKGLRRKTRSRRIAR